MKKKLFGLIAAVSFLSIPAILLAQVPGQVPSKYSYTYGDNAYVRFGNSQDAICGYNTTQTPDSLYCGVSSDSRALVLGEKSDSAYDFAHALQTNPTLFVQSATQSATEWISISHNQTNGLIDVGTGSVSIPDGILTGSVIPSGAASLTLGGSSTTSITTASDDTGDAEEVHVVNSVGPTELSGIYRQLLFCGENAENGTTFFAPATAPFGGDGSASYAQGSTACDALDNVTEATADAPISPLATKIHGMYCTTDGTMGASESIVFTLRTAVGNAVTTDGAATTLTCTIGEGATACRSNAGTTTNIAANATVAMQVVETSNNTDDNAWCTVTVSFP